MQECDCARACSVQIFNFSFLILFFFFKAKDCRSQTTCFACLFNQIPEPFQFIFPYKWTSWPMSIPNAFASLSQLSLRKGVTAFQFQRMSTYSFMTAIRSLVYWLVKCFWLIKIKRAGYNTNQKCGIAQLVEHHTEQPGTILLQVWLLGVARDFSPPKVNFQCRLSTVFLQPSCAVTSMRMLTVLNTDSHATVWTHKNTAHTGRNG